MNFSSIYSGPVISAAVGLTAVVLAVGGAQAVTDTVFKYSSPKTGYFAIDRMAMMPDKDSGTWFNSWDFGLSLAADNGPCFSAGVNLPNGAEITAVTVYYKSGSGSNPTAFLLAHKFADGAQALVGTRTLTDSSGTRKATNLVLSSVAGDTIVNNAVASYGFGICLKSTDNTFFGARISYKYENAGD